VGYRYQAWSYLALGDVAGALAALDVARRLPGLDAYEAFQLGRAYEAIGQPADVIPLWLRAGQEARLARWASDLVELRHYDDAEQIYRALLAERPQDADLLGELGILLLRRRGDAREATELLLRAVAIDPRKRHSLGEYARERGTSRRSAAEQSSGPYDDALAWLRASVALEPDSPAAQRELGTAQLLVGERAEARRSFERALTLNPRDEAAKQALARLGG
jgi:tetratricopeptide (TPR) repeat protein